MIDRIDGEADSADEPLPETTLEDGLHPVPDFRSLTRRLGMRVRHIRGSAPRTLRLMKNDEPEA